jgi:hypothetical protein
MEARGGLILHMLATMEALQEIYEMRTNAQ